MLEFPDKRPENATKIYIPDADLSVIEQQLRQISAPLDDAFANHGATLTLQEPTKSKLAGWVLHLPVFKATMSHIQLILNQAGSALESRFKIVDVDFEAQSVAMSVESYEQSAFQKQVSYTVSDLP